MSEMTKEQIRKFVDAWYVALDQHVPVAEIAKLATDDVEMVFPEKSLHGLNDFKAWCIGGTYSDGEASPGVFNVYFDENHTVVSVDSEITGDQARLRVIVAWQASLFNPPAAKSKRVSLDAIQDWIVKRADGNEYGLKVSSYNAMAEPLVYAPGFSRL